jgi:DNA-binding NarL/FixJ family response regulator
MITTIAIGEDNPNIRRSLKEWVDSALGYRCICDCSDAKTALKEVPRLRPYVVLMDIHRWEKAVSLARLA